VKLFGRWDELNRRERELDDRELALRTAQQLLGQPVVTSGKSYTLASGDTCLISLNGKIVAQVVNNGGSTQVTMV
jgi:hypothetical protein